MEENKKNSFWELLAVSLFSATVSAAGTYLLVEKRDSLAKLIPKSLREKLEKRPAYLPADKLNPTVGDLVEFLSMYKDYSVGDFATGFAEYMKDRKYREENK